MTLDKACVIGGGFYGVIIALYLKRVKGIPDVHLYEREQKLMTRASLINQARIHGGYHYPRSFTTGYRSRFNYHRFISDWPDCINKNFSAYYGVSRLNSKTTSVQFRRFCADIKAPLLPAESEVMRLFNSNLIESVYKVEESVFDASLIRTWAESELLKAKVKCFYSQTALSVSSTEHSLVNILMTDQSNHVRNERFPLAFNCTYSSLTDITSNVSDLTSLVKHELVELPLVKAPKELDNIGVTIIDGPFFSLMPYPSLNCHSLWHVRYSVHSALPKLSGVSQKPISSMLANSSHANRMIRDAARYIPCMTRTQILDTPFEIKATLHTNEIDDGRPILLHASKSVPGLYTVLGGKIDNIYDVLDTLDDQLKIA